MRINEEEGCRRILVMSGFGNLEMSCLRLIAHPVVEPIWVEHWSTDIAKRGIAGHDDHRTGAYKSY